MLRINLFVLCLALPLAAHADATVKLKNFIAYTHSAQADFTQEVLDKNGKRLQSASGTMQFVRPGKFRWYYQKPYEQIIVGDGEKFWMYDVDLNQVTTKKLDAALGNSPAALLSGSNEIEQSFVLKNGDCAAAGNAAERPQSASQVSDTSAAPCAQDKEKLEWLEAKPKAPDANFSSIRMAFNAQSELVVMELRDVFGHNTVLRFSNILRNPPLPPQLFKFEPPKGADVLSE
jgi:outer membrane lipoprotein carrier protein